MSYAWHRGQAVYNDKNTYPSSLMSGVWSSNGGQVAGYGDAPQPLQITQGTTHYPPAWPSQLMAYPAYREELFNADQNSYFVSSITNSFYGGDETFLSFSAPPQQTPNICRYWNPQLYLGMTIPGKCIGLDESPPFNCLFMHCRVLLRVELICRSPTM